MMDSKKLYLFLQSSDAVLQLPSRIAIFSDCSPYFSSRFICQNGNVSLNAKFIGLLEWAKKAKNLSNGISLCYISYD